MPDHSPSTDERASLAQPSQSSSPLECTSHLGFSLVPFPLEYALYQIPVSPARRSRASWNPQLEVTFQYRQIYLEPVLAAPAHRCALAPKGQGSLDGDSLCLHRLPVGSVIWLAHKAYLGRNQRRCIRPRLLLVKSSRLETGLRNSGHCSEEQVRPDSAWLPERPGAIASKLPLFFLRRGSFRHTGSLTCRTQEVLPTIFRRYPGPHSGLP